MDENFIATDVSGPNRVNQGSKDSTNKRRRDLNEENREFRNQRRRELYAKKRVNESNRIRRKTNAKCLQITPEDVLIHEALGNEEGTYMCFDYFFPIKNNNITFFYTTKLTNENLVFHFQ